MKVVPKVVEINNLLTVQLEKNNHEPDHIEKNILVHPNIPAPPPPWILNGSPLKGSRVVPASTATWNRLHVGFFFFFFA